MAEKKIQARIRQKVDTKANWDKATNFVPLKGEYIYYSDLHRVKVGDGTTKVGALPFLADSDTQTWMYIGATNAKANEATTNGNTYLKLYDDNTKRAEFKIVGSGATKVSSDANGNITISSTDTNTHQSVADKNPTLAWSAKSTVATIGGTDIHVTMPANPNTDTHFITGLYVGKANEKSNSATTNGNTYLKLFDNDTKRSQHLIHGTGLTTVTSDASGTITINSTLPTNLVTIDTEQFITGKKYFETDLNFGKYISPIRKVSDAPAKLNLMSSAQTNAGFFDTVMFAGAGDWLYLGHLKPDFSIRASFRGTGDENDTYSANLEYTHGTLNALTDWDYQSGWCVRPTKVSTTTPAIIQIKFTRKLYTDALRLIITGHNLNDTSSGSAYSGFLDDYTIEVCTNYTNDTWTTVVNRTNASDSIGAGLMYSLQTGSYTSCYGIRLKITKCHVTGTGYAFIKISSMQLRDYRPGIKFPDCLGAISQGGGDVWGMLNTNSDLNTHNVLPYANNQSYLGVANKQYYSVYSHNFYENGTNIADKYLNKGSDSTNDNQVVYNPVEMKKALTVPSVQGTKYTDNSGNQQSLFALGGTVSGSGNTSQGSSSLTLYRNRAGSWDSATISFTPADGLKINNYTVGVQNWNNIPASYILTNGDGVTKDYNGGVKLKSSGGASSDDFVFESTNNGKLHSKMSIGPSGLVKGGWCIDNSKILTESSLTTQQWKLTSTSGAVTTINICTK